MSEVYSPEVLEMAKLVQEASEEITKKNEQATKDEIQNCIDNLHIYHALKNAGIKNLPDKLSKWDLKWGFKVRVDNPLDLRIVKRVLGNLQVHEKRPLGDGRSNKIDIVMTAVAYPKLRWYTQFIYTRKLSKKDKCKVVTETRKRQVVVCGNS